MSSKTMRIESVDLPRDTRPDHRDYHGRLPVWVCPSCGATNRLATLDLPRDPDVPDVCLCGAAANSDYTKVTLP